jgi:phosphoglycerate kinase
MLDVGPKTIEAVNAWISRAATLVWNGPLGAFEIAPFDRGDGVGRKHAAARTREGKLVSVAGGGDTVAALNHAGVADDFTYVSTAGGAFLEWLEGKPNCRAWISCISRNNGGGLALRHGSLTFLVSINEQKGR